MGEPHAPASFKLGAGGGSQGIPPPITSGLIPGRLLFFTLCQHGAPSSGLKLSSWGKGKDTHAPQRAEQVAGHSPFTA